MTDLYPADPLCCCAAAILLGSAALILHALGCPHILTGYVYYASLACLGTAWESAANRKGGA